VRRGAVGMILEPFEVDENHSEALKNTGKMRAIKERILKSDIQGSGAQNTI
jgi:hypothetical protein